MKKNKKIKISKKQRIISAIAAVIILVSGIKCQKPSDNEVRASVVQLNGHKRGGCSGEQIEAPSGELYILTAAHCLPLADPNGNMNVVTEDGRKLSRRVIAEDPNSDLALLEGVPGLPGLQIGESLERFQTVRTFTHGRLLPTHESQGEVVGNQEVLILLDIIDSPEGESSCLSKPKQTVVEAPFGLACILKVETTVVTARVSPGSSGGPMVNDDGELVGVVSASDSDGRFAYMVTLEHIHAFLSGY